MELSKVLFWDTNFDTLDYQKHKEYIIEKVLVYGKISDWRQIQAYYTNDVIKEVAVNLRNLDAKTLAFLSVIFDIPKQKFRCFITPPSTIFCKK
jgi:hypothetical protein